MRERNHTPALKCETKNVPNHKGLGEPAWSDHRMRFSIRPENNSSEYHINGGRKQRGSEQDVHVLDDVRHQPPTAWLRPRGPSSSGVTNELDCTNKVSIAFWRVCGCATYRDSQPPMPSRTRFLLSTSGTDASMLMQETGDRILSRLPRMARIDKRRRSRFASRDCTLWPFRGEGQD